MAYGAWDAAKDSLGALGSFLLAVPWFRDFDWRRRREIVARAKFGGASGASFQARLIDVYRRKIETPRVSDLVVSLVGLACIFLSYVISLALGLGQNLTR